MASGEEKKAVPSYSVQNPLTDAVPREVALDTVLDMRKDLWKTDKGVVIITLSGLQKIADLEGIVEKNFVVHVTPSKLNHQQHVTSIWLGFKGDDNKDNWVRGSGEACILNTGASSEEVDDFGKVVSVVHSEHNKIDSQYKFNMAEKRAFARAMKRMVKLYGVYCEEEAPSFRNSAPKAESSSDFDY